MYTHTHRSILKTPKETTPVSLWCFPSWRRCLMDFWCSPQLAATSQAVSAAAQTLLSSCQILGAGWGRRLEALTSPSSSITRAWVLPGQKGGQGDTKTTLKINPVFLPLSDHRFHFLGLSSSWELGLESTLLLFPRWERTTWLLRQAADKGDPQSLEE